jgi:hypothetical protein
MTTIAKPTLTLTHLSDEVDRLMAADEWNETHYRRILALAKELVNGDGDRLEFLFIAAKPEWLVGDFSYG